MDGDGFTDGTTQVACSQPAGYVASAQPDDCNDSDPLQFPGQLLYRDMDNDGYSNGATLTQCARPTGYKLPAELTATSGDCNDNNGGINPVATEVCNSLEELVEPGCRGQPDFFKSGRAAGLIFLICRWAWEIIPT